ncbi:MAG: helix-turn-helix transcriptional regulator [Parachlamydiaceae bacterium]|nr:helix-turn-helix transcriptional regulator [Parachlamydiaceae bacterium]
MNEKEIKRRDNIKRNFGKHVALLRIKYKLTAEELADKTEMERSAISRIEAGGINPSLFIITKLADAFGISVSELMKGFNHKGK